MFSTGFALFAFLLMTLSLLVAAFLFLQERQPKALTAIFFLISIHAGCKLAVNIAPWNIYDISQGFRFLYGPLFYFTCKELLYADFHYKLRHLIHAIPALLAIAMQLILTASDFQTASISALLSIIYVLASYQLIKNFQQQYLANHQRKPLTLIKWLKRITYMFATLICFELTRYYIGFIFKPASTVAGHFVFVVLFSVFLVLFVFKLMRSNAFMAKVFTTGNIAVPGKDIEQVISERSKLKSQLEQHMQEHKPFLDPEITVKTLARQLNVPARTLSELINDEYAVGFREYINRARIDEAKTVMAMPGAYSTPLIDIAERVGFNSKSSFNTMFKRFTNTTPSEFREHLKQNPEQRRQQIQ